VNQNSYLTAHEFTSVSCSIIESVKQNINAGKFTFIKQETPTISDAVAGAFRDDDGRKQESEAPQQKSSDLRCFFCCGADDIGA
jgi:hypothetical protein